MKITKKGTYVVEAMVFLALNEDQKVSLKNLVSHFDWSHKFLEHIFSDLRKAKLVISHRGAKGGFTLAKEADRITCKEIIYACEDHCELISCISQECPKQKTCLTKNVWRNLQSVIDHSLDEVVLSDLVVAYKKGVK